MTATTWVEFCDTLDDPAAFRRLLCGIRGIELDEVATVAPFDGENPYRGLELFDVEHAPLFFGREALTEWLLDALKRKPAGAENRFLATLGASGSGKSSLARAGMGLLPAATTATVIGSSSESVCPTAASDDCRLFSITRFMESILKGADQVKVGYGR